MQLCHEHAWCRGRAVIDVDCSRGMVRLARYTHQNCVRVVPPEGGKGGKCCPKHVEVLRFNKVKVIVNCINLVCVVKLYHDARSTKRYIR
jgi:hypothetical protein